MTTLDTVIEMQKRGMTDFEISKNLQSQGISAREINDAINQAKIKKAIDEQNNMEPQQSIMDTGKAIESFPSNKPIQNSTNQTETNIKQEQTQFSPQQSIMDTGDNQVTNQQNDPSQNQYQEVQPENNYSQPQDQIIEQEQQINSQQENIYQNQQENVYQNQQENVYQDTPVNSPPENIQQEQQMYPEQNLYPDNQYYQDDAYNQGGYYTDEYSEGGQGYLDTETITEIAQQVVNEKFKEYKKKTGDIALFKTMIQDKVNIIEQRLKRIEDNFDKLQHSIIQKVGEFGENTNYIRKDLENLHNTTSKLMNPLIDHYREIEKKKR